MAGKAPHDMPIMQDDYQLPGDVPSKLINQENSLPFWLQRITQEVPYSTYADKEGIALGNFMCKNCDLVKKMKEWRDYLIAEMITLTDLAIGSSPEISVTFFKNWAGTTGGLLLHAKPKYVYQVQMLVQAAKNLNIKVLSYQCACYGTVAHVNTRQRSKGYFNLYNILYLESQINQIANNLYMHEVGGV